MSIYTPEMDVDEIDFVIRFASSKGVSFVEVQVKSARPGLALSEKFLEGVDGYEKHKGTFWLLCADRPAEMEDIKCIFSNNIRGLLNERHSLTSLDLAEQVTLRDAIEMYIDVMA